MLAGTQLPQALFYSLWIWKGQSQDALLFVTRNTIPQCNKVSIRRRSKYVLLNMDSTPMIIFGWWMSIGERFNQI